MLTKKNVISYFIIIIYMLLNACMIFGRIYDYNPESNYDISKACVILGLPFLLLIVLMIINIIIRVIRDHNDMVCTQESGKSGIIIYTIFTIILFISGIFARIYFVIYSPGGYISVISRTNSQNPENLYSDIINLTSYIIGNIDYSILYINVILSVALMLLLYIFSRKAISSAAGFVVLFLTAFSPYELIRCLTFSPDLFYSVIIFSILNIYICAYEKYKIVNQKGIKFAFVMILIGVLSGMFLLISPIALALIISIFIFTRFRIKDIFQSLLYLLMSFLVYFGLIHLDKYIMPVDFIHSIHNTAELLSSINLNTISPEECWNNFTLLCSENPIYNNYIIDTYVNNCIWMFINIFSIIGSIIMLKRNRSFIQLVMQIIIMITPLYLLLYSYSESKSWYSVIYSMLVCVTGYTLYNLFSNSDAIIEENEYIDTSSQNELSKSVKITSDTENKTPDTNMMQTPDTDMMQTPDTDMMQRPDTDMIQTPDTDMIQTPDTDNNTFGAPHKPYSLYTPAASHEDNLFFDTDFNEPMNMLDNNMSYEYNTENSTYTEEPEPLKISDILSETATTECISEDTNNSTPDDSMDNILPIPRYVAPYGISDKAITVRDYQGNNKVSFNKEQWEIRKQRAHKKNETR